MRDLYNNIEVVEAIPPESLTANRTSDLVDLEGFGSACFLFHTGAEVGGAAFTADVQHSDTDTAGDFVSVDDADLQYKSPFDSLPAESIAEVGYLGAKRYVRVILTKSAGTSMLASVTVIKSRATVRPAA